MSAQNGQRARFQINRKRRVVRNMHLRAVQLALKAENKEEKATTAPELPVPARSRSGPALQAGN